MIIDFRIHAYRCASAGNQCQGQRARLRVWPRRVFFAPVPIRGSETDLTLHMSSGTADAAREERDANPHRARKWKWERPQRVSRGGNRFICARRCTRLSPRATARCISARNVVSANSRGIVADTAVSSANGPSAKTGHDKTPFRGNLRSCGLKSIGLAVRMGGRAV